MVEKKSKRFTKNKALKIEDFKFLNDTREPKIMLGIRIPYAAITAELSNFYDFAFNPGREWVKIQHQCGGMMCHQEYFIGTYLAPKDGGTTDRLRSLADKWLDSNVGAFEVSLNDLLEYRDDLKLLFGADCNNSYSLFREGLYPIDVEFLPALTNDLEEVKDYDNLIKWESGFDRAVGSIGRWNLVVLGENCD